MQLLLLIRAHAWLAVAALVIAALLAAAKSPKVDSLFARVPREQRPRVVLALGLVSGVLEAVTRGAPWSEALAYGVVSAALAALGHGVAGGLAPVPQPAPAEGPIGDSAIAIPEARDTEVARAPDTIAAAPPEVTPDTAGVPRVLQVDDVSPPWGPR